MWGILFMFGSLDDDYNMTIGPSLEVTFLWVVSAWKRAEGSSAVTESRSESKMNRRRLGSSVIDGGCCFCWTAYATVFVDNAPEACTSIEIIMIIDGVYFRSLSSRGFSLFLFRKFDKIRLYWQNQNNLLILRF